MFGNLYELTCSPTDIPLCPGVTYVILGEDFVEKGTHFKLFSCNFGNPRLTITTVKPVTRVLLTGWSALSTRANAELTRASAQPLQQPNSSRNAGARLSCRTQIPHGGARIGPPRDALGAEDAASAPKVAPPNTNKPQGKGDSL